MKDCNFGVLDLHCKKKFQSQTYFRNDLLGFSAMSNFLGLMLSGVLPLLQGGS